MTRSFGVFFDLRLNKRLSKQSRRRWFQTPFRSLWRDCNGVEILLTSSTMNITICHPSSPVFKEVIARLIYSVNLLKSHNTVNCHTHIYIYCGLYNFELISLSWLHTWITLYSNYIAVMVPSEHPGIAIWCMTCGSATETHCIPLNILRAQNV